MAPKKKAVKQSLTDFFADTTGGSWADDMDLPSAPAARENTGPKRGEPGYLDSMPDRASREATFAGAPPQREALPIPDVPPFTAYVGNLTFELDSEDAVREFFADLDFVSVRILKDNATGKPKGFGYVEFPSKDSLKAALDRSGQSLQGRVIRVNVAEPPSQRRDALPPSAAEESNQWRRATPLPSRTDAAAPARRTSSFSPSEPGPERDWSSARGARFTPAPPAPAHAGGGDFRREGSGAGRVREPLPPSHADETDQWRSKKPMADLKATPSGRDVPPHQRPGLESGQSSPGLADTESTWSRGSKLRAPVALEPPVRSTTNSPGEEQRDWRSPRATPAASQPGSADGGSPRLAPPAPQERKRLQLAPRSVPATPSTAGSADSDAAAAAPSGRASIFGSAKPIDSAAKEAAAAAKLAQRDEERKKAREAELVKQKEEDEKAKQFAEERLKSIKAAQDKAQAEVSGGRTTSQPGRGSQGPRDRQQSNSANANRNTQPSRKGSSGPAAAPAAPAKDEEGFEAVRGGKGAASAAAAQTENRPKKDYNTRPQFSFAAAARAESFVEGQNDDEVDEAAKGVEGVKV
ncbi:hypothetical protein IAU59_000656 [Kwoniella sp. CBS 9459]